MRIFVAGSTGQVATALVERASARASGAGARTSGAGAGSRIDLVAIGRPSLDLSTGSGLGELIEAARPDVVVDAAAYTAVDRAESEPDAAFALNRDGAGRLAAEAARLRVPFVHLSTDYVYDGSKSTPYLETDPTGPIGVYGRSKLEGELAVLAAHPGALVLRTAWVYSPFGQNFVRTMLRLASERDVLRVVDDQIGNPTSALDIADAILTIAARLADQPSVPPGGVYHLAGTGETTWCGFARTIMAEAGALGHRVVPVEPIATADYPTPARRPANSRLDTAKLAATFGIRLPAWEDSLTAVIARLVPRP